MFWLIYICINDPIARGGCYACQFVCIINGPKFWPQLSWRERYGILRPSIVKSFTSFNMFSLFNLSGVGGGMGSRLSKYHELISASSLGALSDAFSHAISAQRPNSICAALDLFIFKKQMRQFCTNITLLIITTICIYLCF